MARLSPAVSFIFIVVGVVLMYFILHSHGWNLAGGPPLGEVFRVMPVLSRALVVAGLIIAGWGTGAFLNGLIRQK